MRSPLFKRDSYLSTLDNHIHTLSNVRHAAVPNLQSDQLLIIHYILLEYFHPVLVNLILTLFSIFVFDVVGIHDQIPTSSYFELVQLDDSNPAGCGSHHISSLLQDPWLPQVYSTTASPELRIRYSFDIKQIRAL